jgi:bifunctional lysine-specific demethylase and histidyl-hydroxylase NO66
VQGFAPHYDDVDVFVVQTEGRKRWRLYAPLPDAILPAVSSPDFDEADGGIGEPLLDAVLRPGDMLYLPRGTIHQAEALEGEHSLHVTISANQRTSWADFVAAAMQARSAPAAVACVGYWCTRMMLPCHARPPFMRLADASMGPA